MDAQGRYTAEIEPWVGHARLRRQPPRGAGAQGRRHVVRHETYDHPYPHCWRCAEPLVYRAVSSWFVQVTAFRDRMVELNQEITWVPEHIKDGSFGKWLANARDWSISRNRFWGSPIPVWKSDDPRYPRVDVYGSLDELERDFGIRPTDLHRPMVDELVRPNPDDPSGQSMMRRVPEVLDCWFESGSMPYAQVTTPSRTRSGSRTTTRATSSSSTSARPAAGSTRSTSGDGPLRPPGVPDLHQPRRPPRRRRPEDVEELAQLPRSVRGVRHLRLGRHALVPALVTHPARLGPRRERAGHPRRRPTKCCARCGTRWSFFTLYANAEDFTAQVRTDQTGVLDRYLLAKLHELVVSVTGTWTPTTSFAPAPRCAASSMRSRTGTSAAAATASGTGDADAFGHACTPALHVLHPSSARRCSAAFRDRGDLPLGSHRQSAACTITDWPDGRRPPCRHRATLAHGSRPATVVLGGACSIRQGAGPARVAGCRCKITHLSPTSMPCTCPPFADIVQDEVERESSFDHGQTTDPAKAGFVSTCPKLVNRPPLGPAARRGGPSG
jgi:isoleucyl-tRNA synthetase